MNFFRKHQKIAQVLIAVASIALVAASLLPILSLR